MVLKLHPTALVLWIFSQVAFADSFERFTITSHNCSVKVRNGESWDDFDAKQFTKGSAAVAKFASRRKGLIVFKTAQFPGRLFVGRRDCMIPDSGSKASKSLETKWMPHVAFLTWQENLNFRVKGIIGTSEDIRATNVGICTGLQFLFVDDEYEYGGSTCFLYGKGQAANRETPSALDGIYVARNFDVFAYFINPSIYWRPQSGSVAFGFQTPLGVRVGRYPIATDIASDSSIGPRVWFLLGAMIETRLERGGFYLSQRVGFLNTPRSLAWGFESGWTF